MKWIMIFIVLVLVIPLKDASASVRSYQVYDPYYMTMSQGCWIVKTDKDVYAPGENINLQTRFNGISCTIVNPYNAGIATGYDTFFDGVFVFNREMTLNTFSDCTGYPDYVYFYSSQSLADLNNKLSLDVSAWPSSLISRYDFRVNKPGGCAVSGPFNKSYTAPMLAGTHNIFIANWYYGGWGIGWNETLPIPYTVASLIDNAQFVSYQNLPTTVTPGQTFTASITMRNNGDTTWTPGANYKLGSQNPQDNTTWGMGRLALASNVAPGANGIFTATFTAPSIPDVYNFQWRMLIEGVKWFGAQTTNQAITVALPPCTPTYSYSCSNPVPDCTGHDGETLTGSVTCNRTNTTCPPLQTTVVMPSTTCGASCVAQTVTCPSPAPIISEYREVAP